MRKLLATMALMGLLHVAGSQPIVSYYLECSGDLSRGRPFKTIEESHEVLITGVSTAPRTVVKQFNSLGYITSQLTRSSAGGITSETKWEYIDGKRLMRKHHRFFVNIIGWREEEVIIKYNEETSMPEFIDVFKDGNLFQHATVRLDASNQISTVTVFLANGTHIFTERLRYMPQTNTVRVFVYKPGEQFHGTWAYPIDHSQQFVYELVNREFYPNGDVKMETLSDPSKVEQAYLYEYNYDSQVNWIEKETYQVTLGRNNRIRTKKLEHRVTRTITYQ